MEWLFGGAGTDSCNGGDDSTNYDWAGTSCESYSYANSFDENEYTSPCPVYGDGPCDVWDTEYCVHDAP